MEIIKESDLHLALAALQENEKVDRVKYRCDYDQSHAHEFTILFLRNIETQPPVKFECSIHRIEAKIVT